MIKAVLIDIDNTILDFNKCAASSMEKALELYNIDYSESMFSVFKIVNDCLWKQIELGTLTVPELYKIRWDIIFKKLNIKLCGSEFEDKFLGFLHESAEPVLYAPELLKYLSERYFVYAASNAPHTQQCSRLSNADLLRYFSGVFTSELLGVSKPERAFFDACFKRMNVPTEYAVMIGDSLTADIYGSINFGIKAIWFNYSNLPIPDGLCTEHIVYSLEDICNIL